MCAPGFERTEQLGDDTSLSEWIPTIQILPKSYKGAYPFKLGTTSFIYQDDYIPNVKMLGPYIDEIELLMFESKPGSLPKKKEIDELSLLSKEFALSYNIHLPIDISFGNRDPVIRQHAVDAIQHVLDLTSPLFPSTCTLHLSYGEASREKENVLKWQELTYDTIRQFINYGINSEEISIENLNYPFEWIEDIVRVFNFSICMDIGHLIVCGKDIKTFFDSYSDNISIIHLHGVENGHDHISLERLPGKRVEQIMEILNKFTKTVSLEVFSFNDLATSLKFLEKCWK
ncbi:MAG: sugar phosphate isomerase/epimerase [Deltaproteobacteria bacterium]|nr:sugar phosphate isomerase/epimerase [Deltaproteobacteria bacterium]